LHFFRYIQFTTTMLFGSTTLAQRIESAQSRNQADYAATHQRLFASSNHAAIRIGTGTAVFAGVDSPLTQSFGLGFDDETNGAIYDHNASNDQLSELEDFFFSRNAAVNIEVANLAHPQLTTALGARGYAVCEYSHVLGLALSSYGEQAHQRSSSASSSTIEAAQTPHHAYRVATADMGAVSAAIAAGFLEHNVGESEIPPDFQEIFTVALQTEGSSAFAVKIDGKIAGAGGMTILSGLAMLSGASTQPQFRKRGVQQALIHARLQAALEAGCDIAQVSTAPGTASQSNMQALGFEILYARTKFTKQFTK
jgi:GNAT superfamily N-acetyltransferase